MTGVDFGVIAVLAAVAIFLLGTLAHVILGEFGFGRILNGIILVLGLAAGAYARYLVFG